MEDTLNKFEERFEEEYDVEDDPLYSTWAKLKKRFQPLVDITNLQKSSLTQASTSEMMKVDPQIC